MNPSELDATAVLRGARQHLSPSAEDGARVRAAVGAALAAGPMGDETGATASHGVPHGALPAAARPGLASVVKLGMAAAVAAATGVGGYWLGFEAGVAEREERAATRGAERAALPSSAAPQTVAPPSPPVVVREAETARPARVASGSAPSVPTGAAPEESPLELETRLLARVERSLRERNPLLALGLLGELDRDVPGGQLAEERQAARVMAHCALGSESAARQARDFAKRHAGSAYLPRIEQACSGVAKEQSAAPKTD
jgi:hypothetical protein